MKLERFTLTLLVSTAILLLQATSLRAVPLLGLNTTDTASSLYDMDPATGTPSNSRALPHGDLVGITFSAAGVLYTVSDYRGAGVGTLFTVDPASGGMSVVGDTGRRLYRGDLGIDPTTGLLYAVRAAGSDFGASWAAALFEIDTNDGSATTVAEPLGSRGFSGMAFNAQGTLFVLDPSAGELLTISPLTAEILATVPLDASVGNLGGMDFDPDIGILYVGDGFSNGDAGTLYTLDTGTGNLTALGPTEIPFGLSGLAFVPEPTTLGFVVLGALPFARRLLTEKRS